jgi:hypothetical protein
MGEWIRLHNGVVCDMCSSPNITQMIQSRRMRSMEDVAHVVDERRA